MADGCSHVRNTPYLHRAGQRQEGPSHLFRPVDLWPMAERQQYELGGGEEHMQMLGDATVQVPIARTPDEANRAGERGQLAGAPSIPRQGGMQIAREAHKGRDSARRRNELAPDDGLQYPLCAFLQRWRCTMPELAGLEGEEPAKLSRVTGESGGQVRVTLVREEAYPLGDAQCGGSIVIGVEQRERGNPLGVRERPVDRRRAGGIVRHGDDRPKADAATTAWRSSSRPADV